MTSRAVTLTQSSRYAHWMMTVPAALAIGVLGAAELLRLPSVIDGLTRLGYPAYFATILGAWKLAGAGILVAPGVPRLKEWAYAGIFFTLTGAALSHAASRDPLHALLTVPLLVLILGSWNARHVDMP